MTEKEKHTKKEEKSEIEQPLDNEPKKSMEDFGKKTEYAPEEKTLGESEKSEKPLKQKEKASQKAGQKEKPKKPKKEHSPDFKYIIRIADTDIDGEKQLIFGLTSIKGIGRHLASLIADKSGIKRTTLMGELSDEQIEKIKKLLGEINQFTPPWMLNHRKDMDTGKNLHLISTDVDRRLRDDINLMKMIRCYRGVRHELGLPVRGQRTKSNGRKGLALGVQKKREAPATETSATTGGS